MATVAKPVRGNDVDGSDRGDRNAEKKIGGIESVYTRQHGRAAELDNGWRIRDGALSSG